MRLLLASFILLAACTPSKEVHSSTYPGKQHRYQECHILWDLGYTYIDILKCEKDIANPKYKLGTKIIIPSKYAKGCKGYVIANSRWSLKNEILYTYKMYCDNVPQHDEWCEKGNSLNCPETGESNLGNAK